MKHRQTMRSFFQVIAVLAIVSLSTHMIVSAEAQQMQQAKQAQASIQKLAAHTINQSPAV